MTLTRLAPLLALVWCALLGPIQSGIWHANEAPSWIAELKALHAAAQTLYSAVADGIPRYDFFGRLFTATYAGMLVGVFAAPAGANRIAHRLLGAALVVACLGDIVAYWFAGIGNAPLRAIGFWYTEVPALAVATLAMAVAGVPMIRAGLAGGYAVAATPLVSLAATAAIQYMPHGPAFGLALGATIMAWQRSPVQAGSSRDHGPVGQAAPRSQPQ